METYSKAILLILMNLIAGVSVYVLAAFPPFSLLAIGVFCFGVWLVPSVTLYDLILLINQLTKGKLKEWLEEIFD